MAESFAYVLSRPPVRRVPQKQVGILPTVQRRAKPVGRTGSEATSSHRLRLPTGGGRRFARGPDLPLPALVHQSLLGVSHPAAGLQRVRER
eukprot:scaffold462_cov195-Pinguiococcus_pyrenoidosus.AAC.23